MEPIDTSLDARNPGSLVASFTIHGDPTPLFAALAMAQAKFGELKRSRTVNVRTQSGPGYTFDYAPLDEVLAACVPALNQQGLAFLQPLTREQDGVWVLRTIIAHKDGSWIEARATLPDPQKIQDLGSSSTYARRYCAQSILGVAAEFDDDAGAASGHETVPVRARARGPKAETSELVILGKPPDSVRDAVMQVGFRFDVASNTCRGQFEAKDADVVIADLAKIGVKAVMA